jgi:hypothetical protein
MHQLGNISGTNHSEVIELIFNMKIDLEAIYLLSDGIPNLGVEKAADIKTFVE